MSFKTVNWSKGIVRWTLGGTLYLSVPFTWLLPQARRLAAKHRGPVVAGGPAVDLMGVEWAETQVETPGKLSYDILPMHNPLATFTTRGCPRRCKFCAVPKIEGKFRELRTWRRAPIICDNNLLAASQKHFAKVIRSLRGFPSVDFNQGLDARRFKRWHAGEIAKLQQPVVRFAFDHSRDENVVEWAVATAFQAGLKDIRVYVLIGFDDTPADALHRLETVRGWGRDRSRFGTGKSPVPVPMRYQPLDTLKKNSYIAPTWTQRELFDMSRFYSNLCRWRDASFEEYVETGGFGNRKV